MHFWKFWNCPSKTKAISKFQKSRGWFIPKNCTNQTCDYWWITPGQQTLYNETSAFHQRAITNRWAGNYKIIPLMLQCWLQWTVWLTKIITCEIWKITLSNFFSHFKIFPKTAVLIQIKFPYSCFLQKFSLYLPDVEPSRSFNGAFYFSFSNTIKPWNKLPSIFNPLHLENKFTSLWKCYCTLIQVPTKK